MFKHSPRLKKIYNTYNRKFFDNTLPHDTQIGYNDEMEGKHGLTLGIFDDESNHLFFFIYISPTTHSDKAQLKLTVLHECAHVKLYPYMKHGKRFEEEMYRLAGRGAMKGLW
jgi:hypothetical protein